MIILMLWLVVYKSKQKHRNKKLAKKSLLSLLVVVILAIAVFAVYKATNKKTPPAVNTPPSSNDKVNLEPATPTEKSEAEQNKDKLPSEQNPTQPPTSGNAGSKKSVKPVITNASSDSVSAYVSGVFEDNGTCTATFTKGSSTLTKTTEGLKNVSYTQCAPFDLDPGYLSKGTWTVSVKYSSGTSEGTSDSQNIEVMQ